ncbi:hypothetical protein LMG10661_02267 [Ralstonia syzygii subsp. syzygii]|nr:hypothetical protein LMG10661_02267 [Ralstonia syzygii subsp. syzygii]
MPAPMAMVVIRIGRARLWQASINASSRHMPCSRRAMMAYSTSRIEFLVTMPISISRPISAGMEKLMRVISSENSAPPSDSGSAHKMVASCKKSWNSSTSTAYTQNTPIAIASPKLWNSSPMFCNSPCST